MVGMQKTDDDPLATVGLRDLRLLQHLLETTSVTRASERVGMSQPSVSRVLARLRLVLGDELLVRTRRGYALTARAAGLRLPVEEALRSLARVFSPERFEPATTARSFRVATTDYGVMAVVSLAATQFIKEAPHAQLDLLPFTADALMQLEAGTLDLALWADGPLPPDFHTLRLFVDGYACLIRLGHPLLRSPRGQLVDALGSYPQVVPLYPDGRGLVAEDVLTQIGAPHARVAIRTAYFASGPSLLAGSDLVMCIPERMAARITALSSGLTYIKLPRAEYNFEYRCIWHARSHRDAGVKWLRGLLQAAARSPG